MKDIRNVLVVCVDRDNDLGRKAGVEGPVMGKQKNLNAAGKLGLADPADSDVNSVFAAVAKYEEIKGQFPHVEVVTLTGHSKKGFESDRRVNEQLDAVLDRFPADGFVFVTDGAEDDLVLPILQSRGTVISKEIVIVKQAKEVESTFYTIKEALKDPYLARIVFGIPGLILILYAALNFMGFQTQFWQIIAFVVGIYFLLKGTGLEDGILSMGHSVSSGISMQRTSFPFYMAMILVFLFGIFAAYSTFVISGFENILVNAAAEGVSQFVFFSMIAGLLFIAGRAIDVIHLKKAFYLRKYAMMAVFMIVLWFMVDSAKQVIVGQADLNIFLLSVAISFAVALLSYRASAILDVRKKVTPLLIGLPVFSPDGKWVGKVENVNRKQNSISVREIKGKKSRLFGKRQFLLKKGRIVVNAAVRKS